MFDDTILIGSSDSESNFVGCEISLEWTAHTA